MIFRELSNAAFSVAALAVVRRVIVRRGAGLEVRLTCARAGSPPGAVKRPSCDDSKHWCRMNWRHQHKASNTERLGPWLMLKSYENLFILMKVVMHLMTRTQKLAGARELGMINAFPFYYHFLHH